MIKKLFELTIPHEDQRIILSDYFRGLLMLLVLLQHADVPGSEYILQFHMPAFFFLSGYTESLISKKQRIYSYIKSKFRRLIIPYFAFETINCILYALLYIVSRFFSQQAQINIHFNILDSIFSILLCLNTPYKGLYGRLWFFPAIFFASIFVRIITELTRDLMKIRWIFIPVLFVLSYLTSSILSFRLPFATDIAFLGAAFMLLGIQLGSDIEWLVNKKHNILDVMIITICAIAIAIINRTSDPICLMYKNEYSDYVPMIIVAFLGTLIFLILSKWVHSVIQVFPFLHKVIMWYSINSLVTFPVHLTIKIGMIVVFKQLNYSSWFLLFLSMMLINIPVTNFVTQYLPFMLGKRKLHA